MCQNENFIEHIIKSRQSLPINQIIFSPLWLIALISKKCAQQNIFILLFYVIYLFIYYFKSANKARF